MTAVATRPETPLETPKDPSSLGYPPMFPMEIALKTAPIARICEAYGYDEDDWNRIRVDPIFRIALVAACDALKADGAGFKIKAQLQAEQLLTTTWQMIHDVANPPTVRADLAKFIIRAAGRDASVMERGSGNGTIAPTLNIQLNLG